MDLKTIQQIQTDVAELLSSLRIDFVTPTVEVEDAESVKIELKVDSSGDTSPNLGLLIGQRGETLSALQYVVALMVNRGREEWLRVQLDVDVYRQKRRSDLEELAYRMAETVRATREPITLRPMSSVDRRIVHITLSDVEGVKTESTGEGRNRRVVIEPAT